MQMDPGSGNFASKPYDMKKFALFIMAISSLTVSGQTEAQDTINAQELNEIVVNGEKPQIKSADGVMVVDLPAIVKDKPVTNVLEAIGYAPGIVNNNGSIALNGVSNVTIILNGEPTNMPMQNLYQLLYTIPVDRLKNIEIMYAAPAKYHVSGAVINIVLKTPRAIDGLMGQARLGYRQSHNASYCGVLAATYASKHWTFDVSWTLSHNKSWHRQETYSNHLINDQRTMIEDDMRQTGKNIHNLVYASVSYKKLKLTYNGQIKSKEHNTSLSTGSFGYYVNNYSFQIPAAYQNMAFRYDTPSDFSIGGDYTIFCEKRNQLLTKSAGILVNAINSQHINRYHAYADQKHRLGLWELNYGVEYLHSDDHSCQRYIQPQTDGFNHVLKEDVADVYVGVQASFDWGLSFNASAKAEYFHNNHQHNWNLVPQLASTYYKTPKSIFQLNFTSQRIYPQYWELHGGTSYINDYSTIKGNPGLQPYMNYATQLSYILNQKYAATLYILYDDNYAVQLPYQQPNDLHLLFQTINLDFSRTVGFQIHAPLNLKDIINSTIVANVSHKQEKASYFHDIEFDNKRWSFYGALNNTIKPTPSYPVTLSVDISYITGQIQGPGKFNSFWKIDAGAKWMFGKKQCCELSLKCNDIFNTWTPKLTINNASQDYRIISHDMLRDLNLSFIWRFNGFKPKNPSVDTSRFGTSR